MIVGNGVPQDQVLVSLDKASLDFRVFLEALDPKARLATLERRERRVTVRMDPQAFQDNLGPQVNRAYGELLELLGPKVTGDRQGPRGNLEKRVNGDHLVQWDPRDSPGLLDILEWRVLRGHQDLLAAEEKRGSLVAPGTLQWVLMVLESKEKREMLDSLDPEELLEPKGNKAHLDWLFLETLGPKETLETGVPLASLAEQDPQATRGLLERREILGDLAPQDLSAPEEEMVKLERKVTRASRATQVCLEKPASVALGAPLGPGGLWVRKASRETLEKTDGMAALDHLDPRVTVGSRAPQVLLDGRWMQELDPETRESLDRKVLEDPRVILAPLEPLEKGALTGFGDPLAHRETQVSEALQETRVIGGPQVWMAGMGWMGNQVHLAPQGHMVLQAKLETLGEMGFQAFEENTAPLANLVPLVPLEYLERQARMANLV